MVDSKRVSREHYPNLEGSSSPVRKVIKEELLIYLRKYNIAGGVIEKEDVTTEFVDALEHNISKVRDNYFEGKIKRTIEDYEKSKRVDNEQYSQTIREKNERIKELSERNDRLHSDAVKREKREKDYSKKIEDLQKKVSLYEERLFNPLVVYNDKNTKVDFFKDPLIKHLEEEVGFLRSLVVQYTNK
jgi:predicted nuclease with TOPRIM domain